MDLPEDIVAISSILSEDAAGCVAAYLLLRYPMWTWRLRSFPSVMARSMAVSPHKQDLSSL